MKKKLRVAVLFGGRSAEHEVSLLSARNVIAALDKNKYEPILIGIDKTGRWFLAERANFLLNATNPKLIKLNKNISEDVALLPHSSGQLVNLKSLSRQSIDVVFPVLHGPFGEDGTVQGLLKLAGIPFVGAGVLGSALGMNKDVQKRLLRDAGIPVAKFLVFNDPSTVNRELVISTLGLPVFVKPANLGSSVGVTKVRNREQLQKAVAKAFKYDRKILIEEYIGSREIECSVLGNEDPIASLPGEVIPAKKHGFYSYEAKYIDEKGARLAVPARLTKKQVSKIQKMAIKAYKTLCCEGMARVDMFLRNLPAGRQEVYINEINTIPGFTNISMYPKLWEASGISQTQLLDKLIQLALARFKKETKLRTSV